MTAMSSPPPALRVIVATPLGGLAVTERGGSLVEMYWSEDEPLAPPSPLLEDAADQIRSYFDGTLRDFDLPLDPFGSAFDRRIWKEIAAIPYGGTATYGDIAKRLGTAPRAVGGACARNPIVLVIPCHRVVGTTGKLTGYSGGNGLTTKEALLDHERSLGRAFELGARTRPLQHRRAS